MQGQCSNPDCRAPTIQCHEGENRLSKCPHWQENGEAESEGEVPRENSGLLPWSGLTFGTADLQRLAARGRSNLIGFAGLHDAGKTTALTQLYLLLCRGAGFAEHTFAGSRTLGGWEQRAHYLRWPPNGTGTGFPPHTSLDVKREAALLHMAFRRPNGALEDLLFTDAPGEWFKDWGNDRDSPNAEGARWIAQKASAFLLFIDSKALAGEKRGQSRARHVSLVQRLGDEAGKRPVAVVWSKADVAVAEGLRESVAAAVERSIPNYREFAISIKEANKHPNCSLSDVPQIVSWALKTQAASRAKTLTASPVDREDSLLAFRGE